jgi:hypothetical protein
MSGAHQDATKAVYASDAALEGYVAKQAALSASTKIEAGNAVYQNFKIGVSQLSSESFAPGVAPNPYSDKTLVRERFGIFAEPTDGRGRSVGALVSTERAFKPLVTNINSAATFTSGFDIRGSSIVSGKRDTNRCAEGSDQNAVTYSKDVPANKSYCASGNCIGAVEKADLTGSQLTDHVLGGVTLGEIKSYANIKFGYDGAPNFINNSDPSVTQTNLNYNWGCPVGLVPSCATSQYKTRFPVVVIKVPSGKITLNGGYGQGILYIDGNVDITGRFVFEGIVIVTGDTKITGTGNGGTQIQGSFMGLGEVNADETAIAGNAMIQYNKCAIRDAEQALSQVAAGNAPQQVTQKTYGWFELVR